MNNPITNTITNTSGSSRPYERAAPATGLNIFKEIIIPGTAIKKTSTAMAAFLMFKTPIIFYDTSLDKH